VRIRPHDGPLGGGGNQKVSEQSSFVSRLFRDEALHAKRDAWIGRVQVSQPLSTKIVAFIGVVLLAITISYTVVGHYTRRVSASGVLLPRDGLLNLSSNAAGIVASSMALEGQKVKKGQNLFVIDREANSVAGPTVGRVIESLTQQKALLQQQRDLRKSTARAEKEALEAEIRNEEAQHAALAQNIALNEESVQRLKAKNDQLAEAVKNHIVANAAFQSQNNAYLEILARQGTDKQSYLQTEGRIAQAKANLADFDVKTQQSINAIDESILDVEQKIQENEAKQSLYILAPADGILTGLQVHVGQGVEPNTTLVTLLPNSGTMEANLFVDSSAIGFVRVDEPVLLHYAAFPYQKFGLYRGKVTELTRAPITEDTGQPKSPNDKGSLYRIVVVPELPYVLADGKQQRLEAGMQVQASIDLDRRHLYEWIFEPFYRIQQSVRIITGASAP
jgi:membrane fusion protein